MPENRELGLRERKKLDTRMALSDAALSLAFERGLDNVTREDIAARAGVSVRTFNNYFSGKHDAIVYRQSVRIRRSLSIFRERPADEPLWSALTAAMLGPLEDDHSFGFAPPSAEQLAEIRKLFNAAELRFAITKELYDEWLALIAERTGTDPLRDIYPRLVTGALTAILDAVTVAYAHADPPVHITTLLRRAIDEVAAGLPEPPR
ncbi:TetR family transcriptional regulator [Nocardia tenerifensis]|uniref:TetR family transcriptional regulator n=1 Tax=Nocardia tenerifensis TaxID=228006 RepID=A0A318JNY2_9NOCA|nr:TetR family transcriptional regulator [Nocardia tenerifensis]PXX56608.1 TetR family transcriptional regulator [Nocardia tenerifensis]